MKGLQKPESDYLGMLHKHTGWYNAPHQVHRGMTREEEELSDRMVARGLVVFERCSDPYCGWTHARLTPLGIEALKIDSMLKTWEP